MAEVIIRKRVFDLAKQQWIDQFLPTLTVKRHGWARAYAAGAVIASHYVASGSPATVDKVWIIEKARFHAGSVDTIFSAVHSRIGTVDAIYFESPGAETNILLPGVFRFTPGSVRFVMHHAGSTPLVGFGVSLEGPEV